MKRMFCLLLCLCMALSLLPMAAFATESAPLESVTFGYAYDVQRTPAYPNAANINITVSGLQEPYLATGLQHTKNDGSWTLTKLGTFSNIVAAGMDSYILTSLVNSVATNYNVQANAIIVHELKDGASHVAYGVVVAYDAAKEQAIFLGDSLSGSAGYLLSKTAVTTSPLTVTATQIALDFIDPSQRPSNPSNPSNPSAPHTCTKCSVCGGCLDVSCADSACKTKCLTLTMYFSDVPAGQWFYPGVSYVYHYGMMNGVGGNKFDPSGITNRAMLVTILWRLEGSPTPTTQKSFADVPANTWYTSAVRWAAANGIVEGYGNGYFGPEHKLTREEIATILYRYAKFKGYDVSNSVEVIYYFVDANQISNYAAPALKWAYAEGIITGKTSVTLDPKGGATRAEVATILMRFCQKYAGGGYVGGSTGGDTGGSTDTGNDDYGNNYEGDWGWG